jgi:hypothetical protein
MSDTDARAPRSNTTREKTARRKPWEPPQQLAAPEAPPGFVHRWIRIQMRGEDDKTHVYNRLREGWEPVRAEEYAGTPYPAIEEGRYSGIIGSGGLMLCRIPEETVHERAAYYGNRTRDQMQSVDQDLMKDSHPSMPIHRERQSRVTFGGRNASE